jgi:hypothetical protein
MGAGFRVCAAEGSGVARRRLSQREMVGRESPLGGKDSPPGALGSSTAAANRNQANAAQKSL